MWFFRQTTQADDTPIDPPTMLYFLIAGQSNASGRGLLAGKETGDSRVLMFANDYNLKEAFEPVDDATGQLDSVSNDLWTVGSTYGHGFGLRAGKKIVESGVDTYNVTLIPCAKGSTTIGQWLPTVDRLDRTTLFGSANYRHDMVLPDGGLTALLYYGHESNAGGSRGTYAADWATLMAEFRAEWGADLPVVYCQLAKHTDPTTSNNQHLTAEIQRRQETGSGDATEMAHMHMVVTFDLSLIDVIHLDQAAQKTLGDRIGLAVRQHVLGEAVDGTGPRLNGAPVHPGGDKSKIKVDTTQALATISGNADNQFRVFDGASEMTITSAVKDPGDASAILITMSATATGTVTVSYGDVVASGTGVTLANVVKNASGLPLPQFAALAVS